MTDLLPAPVMAKEKVGRHWRYLPDPDGTCTNDSHGPTQNAYSLGCRCPLAVAAHEREKDRNRHRPAQVDADGNCTAAKHHTLRAYRTSGCRCPRARQAFRAASIKYSAKSRGRDRRKRLAWHNVLADDPRKRWRGPGDRVDRINLLLLMGGVIDEPTVAERMVAAIRLTRMSNRWGTGINNLKEVAAIIGEPKGDRVTALLERRDRLRSQRTERRLADARWRQARRERAVAYGRGHDASGHPLHPLWVAAAYRALTGSAPNPPAVGHG